jgi:hypothetical protein
MSMSEVPSAKQMRESVSARTARTYDSLLARMDKDGYPRTMVELRQYLEKPRERLGRSTVGVLVAALRWDYDIREMDRDANEDRRLMRAVTAYCRQVQNSGAPRGGLDYAKLLEWIRWVRSERVLNRDLIPGIILQWACGLRGSQVALLCRASFARLEDGDYLCTMDRQKDPRGVRRSQPLMEIHEVAPEAREYIRLVLERCNDADDAPLFPNWVMEAAAGLVRKGAAALQWEASLAWNGTHCLRHGSVMTAAAQCGVEGAQRRAAHLSLRSTEHYARSNASRITEAARQNTTQRKTLISTKRAPARRRVKTSGPATRSVGKA